MCRSWDGIKWVDEMHFTAWISGLDVRKPVQWDDNTEKCNPLYKWFIFWLYNCKDWNKYFNEVRNCILECVDKKWIKREKNDAFDQINLDTLGLEKYALSSLVGEKILGNSWVKAIGISVITLITSYLIASYVLKEVKTTVVELRYVQTMQQVSTTTP